MAKKAKQAKQKQVDPPVTLPSEPWIQMRTGLILIAITSIVMAVLTAWQAIPAKGTVNGILYGVLFGGLIWVIFFGNLLVNRFLRRR